MNLYSFDENTTFPPSGEVILLDTSFALVLSGFNGENDRTREEECKQFVNRLVEKGIIMATSIKFREELRIFSRGTGEERVKVATDIEKLLETNPNYYPEPVGGAITLDTLNEVDHIMGKFNVKLGDATHYVLAKSVGIKYIATLDRDYVRIQDPELHIYTDTSNYQKIGQQNSTSTI